MKNISDNRYLGRVVQLYILMGTNEIYINLILILLKGENTIIFIRYRYRLYLI